MRSIRLILTNNVEHRNFENDKLKKYKFDKNNSDEKELKRIVIEINKNSDEDVCLITNKEDLFEFFNRNIECEYYNPWKFDENAEHSNSSSYSRNSIPKREIKLNTDLYFSRDDRYKRIGDIFLNNIFEILDSYGSIFNIDIEKLIKGTTYKVNTKEELKELIYEDLNLILLRGIISSRLCIIFYRLTYFDLDASKPLIGKYVSYFYGKSESFKINLNNNPDGLFFTDLNNRLFKGYRIRPFRNKYERTTSEIISDLKIDIAKKLLRNNVKLKIVVESVEISEEELKDIIYNQNKSSHSSYDFNRYKS